MLRGGALLQTLRRGALNFFANLKVLNPASAREMGSFSVYVLAADVGA